VPLDRPLVPDAADELPLHLKMELTLHSRAKALCPRGIKQASAGSSFALVKSSDKAMTLLLGDSLLQAGKHGLPRVYTAGVSKGVLYPDDAVGKGWLPVHPIETKEEERHKAFVDWRSPDGIAIAHIRAMVKCRLFAGLDKKSDVMNSDNSTGKISIILRRK
jgi:hypothetical protein